MKTRREILTDLGCGLGAAAFLSSVGRFSRLAAAVTAPASDYRALVCLFLFGGNDGNNTVIPYDDYASYQKVRGTSLNIARSALLQIDAPSQKASFGLHPSLVELQSLYQAKHLAVVANVGTLAAPITRAQYLAGGAVPDSLFSHFDQQGQWQTATTSATDPLSRSGWGGRTADAMAAVNAIPFPMVVSVAGIPVFTTGVRSRPLVPAAGLSGFTHVTSASRARYAALRSLLALDGAQTLVGAKSAGTAAAIDDAATLEAALASAAAITTSFPGTSLGGQMREIAQVIAARSELGVSRQIFFASLGSFDTHTGQLAAQETLLTQVSQALGAFYAATAELGVADAVTTFTLSDFGRTFQPDAGGGSDHAWGSHHFVLGGSVKGGDFYGTYPTLALGGPDDASTEGRWIPTVAVEEYGATLARWFGLDAGSLPGVFPNLARFPTNGLGFLG